MSRKKPHREIKVSRKVAVRRSATKSHVNKYKVKDDAMPKLPHANDAADKLDLHLS
jgi:hypothetical protein